LRPARSATALEEVSKQLELVKTERDALRARVKEAGLGDSLPASLPGAAANVGQSCEPTAMHWQSAQTLLRPT
jgi:hypothetical protein